MATIRLRQLAGGAGARPGPVAAAAGLGILHRYSNLSWWMQRLPGPAQPTPDALADRWFVTE